MANSSAVNLSSLVVSILSSDPSKAIASSSLTDQINSLAASKERATLDDICRCIRHYGLHQLSNQFSGTTTNLKHLLAIVDQYLVGSQRLNAICERLVQRVNASNVSTGRASVESCIPQTAICLLSQVFSTHSNVLVTAAKSEFTYLVASNYEAIPRPVVSQYVQVVLFLDRFTLKRQLDALVTKPFLECLHHFAETLSAKSSTTSWKDHLESMYRLWEESLKPQLYVAFVLQIEHHSEHSLPPVSLTDEDTTNLLTLRDDLLQRSRTLFFDITVARHLPVLLPHLGQEFISQMNIRTPITAKLAKVPLYKKALDCFALIKLFYQIFGPSEHICKLFADIGSRFDEQLAAYIALHSASNKAAGVALKANHHLATVNQLANYERALTRLVHHHMYNSPAVKETVRRELMRLVNRPPSHGCLSFAKCLAVFMHHSLSAVHTADSTDCTKLEQSLRLFNYLEDKSSFEGFYSYYLGKRLLSPHPIYLTKERFVTSQLTTDYDFVYVNYLEQMIKDVHSTSATLQRQYTTTATLELRINILTPHFWEELIGKSCRNCYAQVASLLPEEIRDTANAFKLFYERRHKNRLLTFCIKHSWAVIEFAAPASRESAALAQPSTKQRPVRLLVTLAQLLVLQSIANSDKAGRKQHPSMAYGAMKEICKSILTEQELHRALKLLLHFGLLSIESGRDQVGKRSAYFDDDQLVFMPEMMSLSAGETINITSLKAGSSLEVLNAQQPGDSSDTKKDLTETEVERQHEYCIDAAIVHIAKKRRQLSYQSLVDQVLTYLAERYKRVGLTATMIDRHVEKILKLEMITIEPAELDRANRSNTVKYCP